MADSDFELQPVDFIRLKKIGVEGFQELYVKPGIPCVIEDLAETWPAYGKWSRHYFRDEVGDIEILYHQLMQDVQDVDLNGLVQRTSLRDFIERLEAGERIKHFSLSHPIYDFVTRHPRLMRDVPQDYLVELIGARRFAGLHPTDARLWPWIPPYPPQFFIASGQTITVGHYDFDASHTFNWCVEGHKSVRLFPFDAELAQTMRALVQVDLSRPIDPEIFERHPELFGLKGWVTEFREGQTLYMPPKTWHFFRNEALSFSFLSRVRSFDGLEGYMEFARDEQGPVANIDGHYVIWRKARFWERNLMGHALVIMPWVLRYLTRIGLSALEVVEIVNRARTRAREYRSKQESFQ